MLTPLNENTDAAFDTEASFDSYDAPSDAHEVDATEEGSVDDVIVSDGPTVKRKAQRAIRLTPAIARRVLAEHAAVQDMDAETRRVLAGALGTDDTVEAVTISRLTAGRAGLTPLAELASLAQMSSPFAAMVEAMSMDRDVARRARATLVALGALNGAPPSKPEAVAAELAEAALGLTGTQRDTLDRLAAQVA
ncbi:hypothetical protein [Microbacterium sp. 13-71-7]|uniref:hypothetical protein n=1 Tax=Microbacterium sp. 13-71-7 TaxID=1970399 RepID=UPI000BDCAED1|nr:hypothetical protein [Microbacterium sp. 13-71-7]OZB85053.1 MAG: hypothetical protein B7X32_04865 [Microbacterium sp. 13-71-7]